MKTKIILLAIVLPLAIEAQKPTQWILSPIITTAAIGKAPLEKHFFDSAHLVIEPSITVLRRLSSHRLLYNTHEQTLGIWNAMRGRYGLEYYSIFNVNFKTGETYVGIGSDYIIQGKLINFLVFDEIGATTQGMNLYSRLGIKIMPRIILWMKKPSAIHVVE